MRKIFVIAAVTLLALASCGDKKEQASAPIGQPAASNTTDMSQAQMSKTISKRIGFDIGSLIIKEQKDLDKDMVLLGLTDSISGKKPRISEADFNNLLNAYYEDYKKTHQPAPQAAAPAANQPAAK